MGLALLFFEIPAVAVFDPKPSPQQEPCCLGLSGISAQWWFFAFFGEHHQISLSDKEEDQIERKEHQRR